MLGCMKTLPLSRCRRSGFTLIELLMVLGVLAILMGMLVPSAGLVREKAQRVATSQKLRHIGLAVATYHQTTGLALVGESLGDWMAKLGQETGIRESRLYLFDEDPLFALVGKTPPPALVEPAAGGAWKPVTEFSKWPVGIAVVSGQHPLSNPSTTPVAWTRGLQTSGKWRAIGENKSGIYGDAGGFIVFLDGHVEFHRDLSEGGGRLLTYDKGLPTADITKAIQPGAKVYDYLGLAY